MRHWEKSDAWNIKTDGKNDAKVICFCLFQSFICWKIFVVWVFDFGNQSGVSICRPCAPPRSTAGTSREEVSGIGAEISGKSAENIVDIKDIIVGCLKMEGRS